MAQYIPSPPLGLEADTGSDGTAPALQATKPFQRTCPPGANCYATELGSTHDISHMRLLLCATPCLASCGPLFPLSLWEVVQLAQSPRVTPRSEVASRGRLFKVIYGHTRTNNVSNIHVSTCAQSYTTVFFFIFFFHCHFDMDFAFGTTPCFPRAHSLQLRVVFSWPSLILMPVQPGAFIDDVNPSKTAGNKKTPSTPPCPLSDCS